jgi:hypothetical protein
VRRARVAATGVCSCAGDASVIAATAGSATLGARCARRPRRHVAPRDTVRAVVVEIDGRSLVSHACDIVTVDVVVM